MLTRRSAADIGAVGRIVSVSYLVRQKIFISSVDLLWDEKPENTNCRVFQINITGISILINQEKNGRL